MPCKVSEMDNNKSWLCVSMWSGCSMSFPPPLPPLHSEVALWNGEGAYELAKGICRLRSPLVVRRQELPAEL